MALYNNGYPATYQPIYPAYSPVPQQPTAQAAPTGLIWVQGEAGAKSYLVAPNSTVQLWDSEAQVVYLKSADASGMPSIKILDYTIRDSHENAPRRLESIANENLSNYATKDDLRAVSDQITALRKRIDKMNRKETEEDE